MALKHNEFHFYHPLTRLGSSIVVSFFFEDLSKNFTWYFTGTLTTDIVKHATNLFWSRFRTEKKTYIYPFLIFEKISSTSGFSKSTRVWRTNFWKSSFLLSTSCDGQLLPKPFSCQSLGINSRNSVFCANHGLLCLWRAGTMSVPQQLTITSPDTSTILSRWIRIMIFPCNKRMKKTQF